MKTKKLILEVLKKIDELGWDGNHSIHVHPEIGNLIEGANRALDTILQAKRDMYVLGRNPYIVEKDGYTVIEIGDTFWTRHPGGMWKWGQCLPHHLIEED